MVVRMRANRSKTGQRRSHAALSPSALVQCECGAMRLPHRACVECGKYNGRVLIDVVARAEQQARRTKRREKEMKESGQITESKKETEPTKV